MRDSRGFTPFDIRRDVRLRVRGRARYRTGFTLLLSILVISMILSVTLGITSIVIKENQLSALVRESEAAFHAADKGIDCALYYHISYDRYSPGPAYSPFATSSAFQPPQNMNTVTCNGVPLNSIWGAPVTTANTGETTFTLTFGPSNQYPCARVVVLNELGGARSKITSEGYNICDTTSPRRTLRVIEVETTL